MNQSNPQPAPDVEAAGAYSTTYASAVRLLARREHSVFELRRKLVGRKFDARIIEQVLVELVDAGYLSDQRFAEIYVRGRYERGMGPLRIQTELRERGIPDDLVADPLEAFSGCWTESARQQCAKRFGEKLPVDFRMRARQMRFLQQRGFTGDQIRTVFKD